MKIIVFLVLLGFANGFAVVCSGQNKKNETLIIKESVKTLKAFVEGNEQSYPAIELNGDAKLLFQFDDLDSDSHFYSYKIIHCNYDWTVSDLFLDQYMDGFSENTIVNYQFSSNTKVGYVHYMLNLPNDDVQFKVSGNYVLQIFEDNDVEKLVLTQQFVVFEPIVRLNTEIIRPLGAEKQNNSQEIKLSINHEELAIDDPFLEVKVVICQNGRPDRILKDINPVFVKNKELIYSFSGENVFYGGNEFRTFSFTNIHKFGLNVNDVQFVDTIYHVQLRLDERRSSKKYFWDEEMNGKSLIYVDNVQDVSNSADYAWVYFSLPIDEPFLEGKVYVFGELTNWRTSKENQMEYNFESQTYEAKLLLKQGYYNYTYAFRNNYTNVLDELVLEGSHYQTENNYLIYVYHRNFSDNYDRLVGYKVVNSKYQEY